MNKVRLLESGIRGQRFEPFKTFATNSQKTYELPELTTDYTIQLKRLSLQL